MQKVSQTKNSTQGIKTFDKVNEDIHWYGQVRLVYSDEKCPDNSFSKIVYMGEARKIAEDMEMDLMEVNSKINPPVIKLLNYSKYLYEQKKASKLKAKNSTKNEIKEIQLSTSISIHDLEIKVNKAKKFIENGSKVKVVLTMKGRELLRREESKFCLYKFIEMMEDVSVPENMPKDENNRSIVMLKKKK